MLPVQLATAWTVIAHPKPMGRSLLSQQAHIPNLRYLGNSPALDTCCQSPWLSVAPQHAARPKFSVGGEVEGSSESLSPQGAEGMAGLGELGRPSSSASFMSGIARSQSEAQVDAVNGYPAPGSPSKLSEELARRLAVADSNPPLPQVGAGRGPRVLAAWMSLIACMAAEACTGHATVTRSTGDGGQRCPPVQAVPAGAFLCWIACATHLVSQCCA